jgi:8-oxo-dGTP diphosphatase
MKFMKKFVVGVGGALFNNGKMLVVKRNADKRMMPNMWEIPGGKIELSEDPQDALKREFLEETGLQIGVDKPFHAWSYRDLANQVFYIEIDYLVSCAKLDKITLSPKEHSEYKWLASNEEVKTSDEVAVAIKKAFELAG